MCSLLDKSDRSAGYFIDGYEYKYEIFMIARISQGWD